MWIVYPLALAVYGVGVVVGKTTGAFEVGPSMKLGTTAEKDAWETERTKRALKWPLSFLPHFYGG